MEDRPAHKYFQVSPVKLAVMSIATAGLYDVYWMYKQWVVVKQEDNSDIQPFWRAVFGVLFVNSLFQHMKVQKALLLAAATIALWLAVKLPGALWLVTVFSFVPLVAVQRQINQRQHPRASISANYSGKEIALIVLGSIVLLLALIGTFAPSQ
jgi:hypothetical protein